MSKTRNAFLKHGDQLNQVCLSLQSTRIETGSYNMSSHAKYHNEKKSVTIDFTWIQFHASINDYSFSARFIPEKLCHLMASSMESLIKSTT